MKTAYRALRCIVLFACLHPVGFARIIGCILRRSCKIDFDTWNTRSPLEGLYYYRCYWHEGRVKCTYGYPAPLSYDWLPLYVIGTREISQNGWLLGD